MELPYDPVSLLGIYIWKNESSKAKRYMYSNVYNGTLLNHKKEISELLYLHILGLNKYAFGENAVKVTCLCHPIISRGTKFHYHVSPVVSILIIWLRWCQPALSIVISLPCIFFVCLITQSCLTLCDSMDYSPPGSSVHGDSPARTLEWVAMPFSRWSSQPRDRTQVSHIAGRLFTWKCLGVDIWGFLDIHCR